MEKVLILGAGGAQADAIKYCKEKGFQVYICGADAVGPGRKYADYFELIDIVDTDKVKQYAVKNKIDLIYSVGSDVAVPTAAYISNELDLPSFIDYDLALLCRRKDKVRSKIGHDHWGNLDFITLERASKANEWDKFPCVVKPTDSQGQKGFFIVKSKEDLSRILKKVLTYSRSSTAIVEDYINGPEISANVYLIDGDIEFIQITDRVVFDEYPGIVKAHIIPSQVINNDMESMVYSLVKNTVESLGLRNGPAYFQMKINNGTPKLIEVAPRLDGCHLWRLIYEYCGVNLLEACFNQLRGHSLDLGKKYIRPSCILRFITEQPGKKVNKATCQVGTTVSWDYDDGNTVRLVNGYQERLGYYIEPY